MIDIQSRKNQHVAVFGLGASGIAAAQALAASGAQVAAWDDKDSQRRAARERGIALTDLYKLGFSGIDALVLAPGVPLTHGPHPIARRAQAVNKPIIGDVELLLEACPRARFIGITGTNGKSTTTSLLGHILDEIGYDTRIGGNLGPPVLAFDPPERDSVFVLELSSYQLDLTHKATFDVAVLLNVSPDHLDRHGDMDGYVAAKRRIFRDRTDVRRTQTAIVGVDDPRSAAIRDDMAARNRWNVISISATRRLERGVFVQNGALYDAIDDAAWCVCDLTGIPTLPGSHNWQNAAAAYAAARAIGVAPDAAAAAMTTFPGLPHRMERVATIGDVLYVNDSKATNADAAARALACYRPIYWIAGGQAKGDGLDAALPYVDNIRHAFLIGDAEPAFAKVLTDIVPASRCGVLAEAVQEAHRMAQQEGLDGAVVLLSPACASFDQFRNFEDRGNVFRALVRKLEAEAAP